MASLAAKVAALRSFFGVPADAPLQAAIGMMNEQMGIEGAGPLPKQVHHLVELTGVEVASSDGVKNGPLAAAVAVGVAVEAPAAEPTAAAEPTPAAAPAPTTPAVAASAKAAGKMLAHCCALTKSRVVRGNTLGWRSDSSLYSSSGVRVRARYRPNGLSTRHAT